MTLQDELYLIIYKEYDGHDATYTLRLRPESIIYKAHFPGQPITPGVCVTQMACEVAADALRCRLCLMGIKNVKFLAVIAPDKTPEVTCRLTKIVVDGDSVTFQCTMYDRDVIFSKMSLQCRKQQ